jgi:hypothetical protein
MLTSTRRGLTAGRPRIYDAKRCPAPDLPKPLCDEGLALWSLGACVPARLGWDASIDEIKGLMKAREGMLSGSVSMRPRCDYVVLGRVAARLIDEAPLDEIMGQWYLILASSGGADALAPLPHTAPQASAQAEDSQPSTWMDGLQDLETYKGPGSYGDLY